MCVSQRLRWSPDLCALLPFLYVFLPRHASCTCVNEIQPPLPHDLRAKHQKGSLGMKGLLRRPVSFSSPPGLVIHKQGVGYFACDSSRMIPNIPVFCFRYHCTKTPSLMTS